MARISLPASFLRRADAKASVLAASEWKFQKRTRWGTYWAVGCSGAGEPGEVRGAETQIQDWTPQSHSEGQGRKHKRQGSFPHSPLRQTLHSFLFLSVSSTSQTRRGSRERDLKARGRGSSCMLQPLLCSVNPMELAQPLPHSHTDLVLLMPPPTDPHVLLRGAITEPS